MNTLCDNPWNVIMSWVKGFGQKGRLVMKINTLLRVPAGVYACNFVDREVSFHWANVNNFLVLGSQGRVVAFNAVDEIKSSVRIGNVMVWTVLDLVEHTLIYSMLAREGPWIPISVFVSISIRNNKDISHVEEVGVGESFSKWASNGFLTVGAEWLDVNLNLYFLGDS